MKKIIIIIGIVIFCFSCKQHNCEQKAINNGLDSLNQQVNNGCNLYMQNIDIFQIKEKGRELSTSTILSKKIHNSYYPISENEYYGFYQLFYNDSIKNYKCVGTMIVYNSEYPWKYDNKTDKLVELLIIDNSIIIFDKITVGIPIDELITILGKPLVRNNHFVIFEIHKNELLSAKIDNEMVIALKIGHYRNSIFDTLVRKKVLDFSY